MLHRTRHLFIRQRTAVINAIRAHLADFGIVAPVGRNGVEELLHVVADASDKRLPEVARACLAAFGDQSGRRWTIASPTDRWARCRAFSFWVGEDSGNKSATQAAQFANPKNFYCVPMAILYAH